MRILGVTASGFFEGGDYQLIATESLTSNQPSVTFSNLGNFSSIYKHLQLRIVARTNASQEGEDILLRINGDSNNLNYYYHALFGTGSVAGSESAGSINGARIMQAAANNFTANSFNAGVCEILDSYASKNKTMRTFSGLPGTYNRIWLASNLYNSTASLSSITLVGSAGGSFVTGSRFSLYGIKG
jgi:hypothetical protein